jgi:hypothetical protein
MTIIGNCGLPISLVFITTSPTEIGARTGGAFRNGVVEICERLIKSAKCQIDLSASVQNIAVFRSCSDSLLGIL